MCKVTSRRKKRNDNRIYCKVPEVVTCIRGVPNSNFVEALAVDVFSDTPDKFFDGTFRDAAHHCFIIISMSPYRLQCSSNNI
jgi:hypothetical protein